MGTILSFDGYPSEDEMTETGLTHARLTECLKYDPETGHFIWKISGARNRAGNRAGHTGPGGRWVISLDSNLYYGARLAWFYAHGEWPSGKIAQASEDKTDCRLVNLSDVTQAELVAGSKVNSLNKSGIKGVSWSKAKAKWVAMITRDGSQHYLGAFETKDDAAAAYRVAAETGNLRSVGSKKDPNWSTSRRQRSAKWADIQFSPSIVGWDSLEQFVADIGEPPTAEHVLMRVRYDEALGPGNATWRLPWSKRPGHEEDPQRSYNLGLGQHKYEIGPEEYDRLFAEQKGLCAICGQPERTAYREGTRRLAVDHSHATGAIRSLLCSNCNNGLGRFDDDPALLRAAADYLDAHARPGNVVPLKKDTA